MPDSASPPKTTPPKRRLPILARHAISLGVVFVLAIPVSYMGLRYYKQQQQLAQLDNNDSQTFELGLSYVYANAATTPAVAEAAIRRIDRLPPERAMELHRVLLLAFIDEGVGPSDAAIEAGARLMDRLTMDQAVSVYRHTESAGTGNAPAVLEALHRHLGVKGDPQFLQLVEFYDSRAMWSRTRVPREAWVRWLLLLSHSNAELTQQLTAKRLGELPEQVNDAGVADALTRLSQSPFSTVRAQTLKSAAGFAAIAKDPTAYEQIIFTLGSDEDPVIARRAWMVVGHLNPYSGFAPNWKDADPYVAEAILWAAAKTNPDQHVPLLEAWDSGNERIAIQAMYQSEVEDWDIENAIYSRIQAVYGRKIADEKSATLFHASLPFMRVLTDDRQQALDVLTDAIGSGYLSDETGQSLAAACCYYCFAGYIPENNLEAFATNILAAAEASESQAEDAHNMPVYIASAGEWARVDSRDFLYTLVDNDKIGINSLGHPFPNLIDVSKMLSFAGASGARAYRVDISSITVPSPMWRNLWLAVNSESLLPSQQPHTSLGDQAREPIRSQLEFESTSGALLAGLNKNYPTFIRGVTADFLRQHPDTVTDELHAMSDEQLAALGLSRIDAVKALLNAAQRHPDPESQYETIALLKLALWMRGDLGDDFTPRAEAMLLDPKLPTSTVLLCLLHMNRPIALEYLFGDLVEPTPDLEQLFIRERFWHVYRRFVKTDAQDLWLWGDPAAQDFQLDAMQQWYWVNRYRLDDYWIDH